VLKRFRAECSVSGGETSFAASKASKPTQFTCYRGAFLRELGFGIPDPTYRQVRLSDADHPGVVEFQPADLGTEALGYAEHQALLTFAGVLAGVHECLYLCPAEVVKTQYEPGGVEIDLKVDGKSRNPHSIVAADGARSRIRTAAGINTRGWQYWQSCIVAFVKPENPQRYLRTLFGLSGPFAILPLF